MGSHRDAFDSFGSLYSFDSAVVDDTQTVWLQLIEAEVMMQKESVEVFLGFVEVVGMEEQSDAFHEMSFRYASFSVKREYAVEIADLGTSMTVISNQHQVLLEQNAATM